MVGIPYLLARVTLYLWSYGWPRPTQAYKRVRCDPRHSTSMQATRDTPNLHGASKISSTEKQGAGTNSRLFDPSGSFKM